MRNIISSGPASPGELHASAAPRIQLSSLGFLIDVGQDQILVSIVAWPAAPRSVTNSDRLAEAMHAIKVANLQLLEADGTLPVGRRWEAATHVLHPADQVQGTPALAD